MFPILFYPLILLLAGCAHQNPASPPLPIVGQEAELNSSIAMRWHSTCFYMDFQENGNINWATDLMLADLVAAPVLLEKRNQLPLWRFHRRAGRDNTGHRFSFIYYTDRHTHQSIGELISQSAALQTLLEQQRVRRINLNCQPDSESEEDIAATSDPNWDPRLQRSWPYYIMGVSAHWLALIGEIKAKLPENQNSSELYRDIESELTVLWQSQGQHAYLHHLSAVFGYQPLVIQNWMQF